MEKVKETSTKVWILGLLLSVLFIAAIIWISLESVHGSDDPADITRKIYIFCGAILLLILFYLTQNQYRRHHGPQIPPVLSNLTGISERLLKPFQRPPGKRFGKPVINPATPLPALYIFFYKVSEMVSNSKMSLLIFPVPATC